MIRMAEEKKRRWFRKKESNGKRYFLRFTVNQRIQHAAMIILFIVLAVTGLPLKYADSEISQAMVQAMGGWEMRAFIHHISGFALGFLGLYHVIMYLLVDRSKKKILPVKKDFKDFWQHMKSLFGKAERPKYGRFSWKEKFDYWAAFWGMCLMGVTGFVMMYPDLAADIFGSYGWVEVAWIAHSEEALLAIMAIAVWHMWNVHFNPKFFPMNKTWITGKLSEKEMIDEHPLEYDEIIMKKKEKPDADEGSGPTPAPDKKGVVTEKT
jgi:cytochrome b subunit of formate dehydrogenase